MHLLYLATSFGSLTHTFIAREVSALRRRGHRVDLLALRPGTAPPASDPECDLAGCHWVYPVSWWRVAGAALKVAVLRPGRWWRAVRAALGAPGEPLPARLKLVGQLLVTTTVLAHVERLAPAVIHAHLANPPASYAMFLSLLSGIPYTFTAHAADLYRVPLGNVQKLRQAAGAVAISRYNLRHYRDLVPGYDRAAIIHCGVPPEAFTFRPRERAGSPLHVLAVGRAVEKKGFADLLDALALLDPDRHPWRATLVGGGPLLAELQRQREALGLAALEITGPMQQNRIQALLGEADVFCLPCVEAADGDIDGIPVSLMEAMASGCPVLSTRVSGVPELLEDGRAGVLVDPHDPTAIAGGLRRLVDEPDLVQRLSLAGRARIEGGFTVDGEAARLERFFAGVIAGALGDELRDRDQDRSSSSR
ncbi:glycosyltransferase [bacterium]|nr:glycosyltransferase [bacterium]